MVKIGLTDIEVTKGIFVHLHVVKVKPITHDYGEGYYKYSCPICEQLGLRFSFGKGTPKCPCCGIKLGWKIEDEF